MDADKNAATKRLMPDAGLGRWWLVELMKTVAVQPKPIKVTLMENQTAIIGRRSLSSELGSARTIADPEKVAEAARTILAAVGRYQEVVGEYGTEGAPERAVKAVA